MHPAVPCKLTRLPAVFKPWPHPLRSPESGQSREPSPLEIDQAPPLLDSGFLSSPDFLQETGHIL